MPKSCWSTAATTSCSHTTGDEYAAMSDKAYGPDGEHGGSFWEGYCCIGYGGHLQPPTWPTYSEVSKVSFPQSEGCWCASWKSGCIASHESYLFETFYLTDASLLFHSRTLYCWQQYGGAYAITFAFSGKNYTTLLLLCKAESASSRAFLAMTSRSIKSKQNPLTYHVHFGEECMLARRRWW